MIRFKFVSIASVKVGRNGLLFYHLDCAPKGAKVRRKYTAAFWADKPCCGCGHPLAGDQSGDRT